MRNQLVMATVLLLSYGSAQSALANNFNTSRLGPAPWGQYRGEVQLLNMNPDVRDFRTKEEDPIYVIHVPPMANAKRQIVDVPFDADNSNLPPGVVLYDPRRPPKAGFESNMGHNVAPRNLPDGTSTNRLGNGSLSGHMAPPLVSSPSGGRGQLIHSAPPISVQPLTYPDVQHASGSDGRVTKADLKGKLQSRLGLINK